MAMPFEDEGRLLRVSSWLVADRSCEMMSRCSCAAYALHSLSPHGIETLGGSSLVERANGVLILKLEALQEGCLRLWCVKHKKKCSMAF